MSGCEVWVQDFFALDLPLAYFDGVFANAALFHIPLEELPRVLGDLRNCLKPHGVLFSSNPRGHNQAQWYGERFGFYHDLEGWRTWMTQAHFVEIEHYYRPAGLPFEQQPWLASVGRSTNALSDLLQRSNFLLLIYLLDSSTIWIATKFNRVIFMKTITYCLTSSLAVSLGLVSLTPTLVHANPDPNTMVNQFEATGGKFEGFRRSGAKGICATGEFIGSAEGRKISSASAFSGKPIPVVVRFSVGGANPKAADNTKTQRNLALQFNLPKNEVWQMGNISAPVFGSATPDQLMGRLQSHTA